MASKFQSAKKSPLANTSCLGGFAYSNGIMFQSAKKSPLANTSL